MYFYGALHIKGLWQSRTMKTLILGQVKYCYKVRLLFWDLKSPRSTGKKTMWWSDDCKWKAQISSDINPFINSWNVSRICRISSHFCFWLIISSGSARGGHLGNKASPFKHVYWYDSSGKGSCTLLEAIVVLPVVLSLPLVMVKLSPIKFAYTSGIKVTSKMGKGSWSCRSLISVHWCHGKEMPILELDIVPVLWQTVFPTPLCPLPVIVSFPFAVNICSICFNLDAAASTPVGKKLLRS